MPRVLGGLPSSATAARVIPRAALAPWAAIALAVSGCALNASGGAPSPAAKGARVAPSMVPAPTVHPAGDVSTAGPRIDDVENMTYTLPDGREIALTDGAFQEKPAPDSATYVTNVHLLRDLVAEGDLDGNSVPDAAVVLVDAPGGSGAFVYLSVVVMGPDGPTVADTVLLGDRVRIDGLEIQDGALRLSTVTHGPDDPMCCPSQRRLAVWSLEGGTLQKTADDLIE